MAASHDADKLTNEIFSILENKFLFGQYHHHHDHIIQTPKSNLSLNNYSAISFSPGKVRILTIDAGGDAILAASTLLHFQSILRRKSGNPAAQIADFFDVVAGAGAGGILAGLLFTKDAGGSHRPVSTAEESLKFMVDNRSSKYSRSGVPFFGGRRRRSKAEKAALKKVFGESTLKDTVKGVLIPCYDLRTGAPFVFSRADAMEMDGCDFTMAGVCGATVADRAVELKSTDGRRRIVAVGGGVGMCNPTAAAITHVLNNKQEFPLCKGVQDLLVLSLGNSHNVRGDRNVSSLIKIAGDGAADVVDEAVSMAFGDEWRRSNYVRININQGGGGGGNNVEEMLGEKNVESVLFKGKKLVELTNMEKMEMFAGEVIKEQERRKNSAIFQTVMLKQHTQHNNNNNTLSYSSPRSSSSDTTLSSLSSC